MNNVNISPPPFINDFERGKMKKEKSTRVLKIINKQDGKIVNEKHSMTYRIGGVKKNPK